MLLLSTVAVKLALFWRLALLITLFWVIELLLVLVAPLRVSVPEPLMSPKLPFVLLINVALFVIEPVFA